jgi:hypothetical protein
MARMSGTQKYIQLKVFGREFYLPHADEQIFRALMRHASDAQSDVEIPFGQIPDDAFIVRIIWQRKHVLQRLHEIAVAEERKQIGNGKRAAK